MGGVHSAYAYFRYEKETVDVGIQADIATFTETLQNKADTETSDGSEEVNDKTCEICSEDGEVEGFCEQCRQWLCLRCCKCHEKTTVSKFHRLVGKVEMKGGCVRKTLIERKCTPYAIITISDTVNCSAYCSKTGYCIVYNTEGKYLQKYSDTSTHVNRIQFPKTSNVTNQSYACHSIIVDSSQKGYISYCETHTYQNRSHMCKLNYDLPKPNCIIKDINGQCYDLKEFDNGFAVSILLETGFSSPAWQVQLLTLSGEVKRQICYDKDGNPLFKDAGAIGTNMAKTVLYVQDREERAVTAFNTGGDVVFKVKHDLQRASFLTVDNDDNIYVANGDTVARVDAGGQGSTVILKGNTRSIITSICFNLRKEHLIIFEKGPCSMKSFSFI